MILAMQISPDRGEVVPFFFKKKGEFFRQS